MTGISTLRRVTAGVLALSVIAIFPAVAAAAPTNRGDHGAQAQCRYVSQHLDGWGGAMRLSRLTVQPPTLFAVGGPGEVGWRLLVQRRYDDNAWKRIYASRIQRANATTTQAADFGPMSARINSPLFISDGSGAFKHADFRVILRFFWYAGDGSVFSHERHRVLHYDVLRDGAYLWTDNGECSHGWIFE